MLLNKAPQYEGGLERKPLNISTVNRKCDTASTLVVVRRSKKQDNSTSTLGRATFGPPKSLPQCLIRSSEERKNGHFGKRQKTRKQTENSEIERKLSNKQTTRKRTENLEKNRKLGKEQETQERTEISEKIGKFGKERKTRKRQTTRKKRLRKHMEILIDDKTHMRWNKFGGGKLKLELGD